MFYRVSRRGAAARAEISIDGQILRSEARPAGARTETAMAGIIALGPGVHALTISPLRGEDLRADYVILSTDDLVAGYGFGVKGR